MLYFNHRRLRQSAFSVVDVMMMSWCSASLDQRFVCPTLLCPVSPSRGINQQQQQQHRVEATTRQRMRRYWSVDERNQRNRPKQTTVQIHTHTHKHARPVCPCTSLADFSRGVTALEAPLEENQRRAGNFCRALLAGSIHDVRRRASTKIQGVKTDGEVTSELLNLWSPQPSHPLHKHGGLLRFRQYCCVVNKIFAPYVRLCFSALNSVGPWDLGWETRWARVCEKREGGEERAESKSVWQPSRIGTPHGSWGELIRRPTFEVWIADSVTNYRRPNTWVRGR